MRKTSLFAVAKNEHDSAHVRDMRGPDVNTRTGGRSSA